MINLGVTEKSESTRTKNKVAGPIAGKPEKDDSPTEASLSVAVDPASSTITLEEAKEKIGPEALAVLSDKFNGKLTEIRNLDQNDVLF